MTNKPKPDAYTCNYCKAELMGAAEYCSPECKINYLQSEIDRLRDAHKLVVDELSRITGELDAARALLNRIHTYCDNYDGEPNPLETVMQMIEEFS